MNALHLRVLLRPRAPLGTPLVSGTLWGHLAWAVRHLQGEEALEAWIEKQRHAPWLLSSGMPAGFLPRPLLAAGPRAADSLEGLEQAKRVRNLRWVPEDLFSSLRRDLSARAVDAALAGWLETASDAADRARTIAVRRTHNSIDRRIASTPERGGLYVSEGWLPANTAGHAQVFAALPGADRAAFDELLAFVAENGYGRDASTGQGVFDFEVTEADELFADAGTRAMSLSHGTLTAGMREPRYRLHTHYGRLGSQFAQSSDTPFKRPLLMTQPGATFGAAPNALYGSMLANVHSSDPRIVQHAFHLPLWFNEAAS